MGEKAMTAVLAKKILDLESNMEKNGHSAELRHMCDETLIELLGSMETIKYGHNNLRFQISHRTTLKWGPTSVPANLRNVSLGGLCLRGVDKGIITVGDFVQVCFNSGEKIDANIQLKCEIRWKKPAEQGHESDFGLSFDLTNPIDEQMAYYENIYYPAYKSFLAELATQA